MYVCELMLNFPCNLHQLLFLTLLIFYLYLNQWQAACYDLIKLACFTDCQIILYIHL